MGEGETGAGRTGGTADSQGRRGHTAIITACYYSGFAKHPFPSQGQHSTPLSSRVGVALVLSSVLESGCGTAFSPPLKKPVVKTEGTWRK